VDDRGDDLVVEPCEVGPLALNGRVDVKRKLSRLRIDVDAGEVDREDELALVVADAPKATNGDACSSSRA
jgi:hypothetical protein